MIRTRTAALLITLPLALVGCAGGSEAEPEPAPTVTVTASPKVVTETVSETPPACLDALDNAERTFEAVRPALDNGAALAGLVSEAYAAGVDVATTGNTASSDAVATKAGEISDSLSTATPEFEAAIEAYRGAAEQCRSAG